MPEVVGLERDPGFPYEALCAAPIAVLGVTMASPEPTSASASVQVGGLLAESLTRRRRDLKILHRLAQVADSLGPEGYTGPVQEYHVHGSLDSRALLRLETGLRGLRYLVLARLEADVLDSGASVEEYTEHHGGRDSKVEQTSRFAAHADHPLHGIRPWPARLSVDGSDN